MTNRLPHRARTQEGIPQGRGHTLTGGRASGQPPAPSLLPLVSPTTHLLRALTGSKTHSHTAQLIPAFTLVESSTKSQTYSTDSHQHPSITPTFTHSQHPHTNTHTSCIYTDTHTNAHQAEPNPNRGAQQQVPNFTPLGLPLLTPQQEGNSPVRGHAGQAAGAEEGTGRWRGRKTV